MADDLWDSQAPLSNEQFRQLLETPLHKRKASLSTRQRNRGKESAKKAKQSATETEKTKEDTSPLPEELATSQLEFEAPSDRPLYRDRARERREGKNAVDGTADGSSLFPSYEGMSVDAREVTVEESKFLGGDLEHTHLVKGLDYALLKKERARIQKTQEATAKKQQQSEKLKQTKRGVSFASPMGRAIYSALFKPNKAKAARTRFQPGQTAFLYSLEDGREMDYRPTILRRPKAECEDIRDHVMANVDTNVVNTISTIISYMRASTSGKSEKKGKKKEKQQLLETMLGPLHPPEKSSAAVEAEPSTAPLEMKAPPPEDDIFGDAGTDYKCEVSKKKKRKTDKSKTPVAPSEDITQQESNEVKDGRDAVEDDDRAMLTVDRKTEKDIDPTSLPDHYAECYPGFHQSYAAAVVDSDDEDFSHMDARGKGVSRYNFETDEEWSKYKQNMEQLPKAAFQYGVKMTDGRKTHSKLVEKHRKEQKLDSQLSKIEKLFKDQGHSHDSAFRSEKKKDAPNDDEGTPAPSSTATLPTPKNRKRLRLGEDQ